MSAGLPTLLQLLWSCADLLRAVIRLQEVALQGSNTLEDIAKLAGDIVTQSERLKALTGSWFERSLGDPGREPPEDPPSQDDLPF